MHGWAFGAFKAVVMCKEFIASLPMGFFPPVELSELRPTPQAIPSSDDLWNNSSVISIYLWFYMKNVFSGDQGHP